MRYLGTGETSTVYGLRCHFKPKLCDVHLHRQADYHEGKDLREKPYGLFPVAIEGTPVQLR
jgi:hypothetical protein